MAKYYCDYCGNPVTRYGKRAESYRYHFCDRDCFDAWMRKNGPINHPDWKQDKLPICTICKTKFKAKTFTAKYCPTCKKISYAYRDYLKRNPTKKLNDYLTYLESKNSKTETVKKIRQNLNK